MYNMYVYVYIGRTIALPNSLSFDGDTSPPNT